MASELYAIGLSHHGAPLSIRERIVLPVSMMRESLIELSSIKSVGEVTLLSTCNRTEIYCTTEEPEGVKRWLSNLDSQRRPAETLEYIRINANEQAAFHAFKVASGLDSMVIGEPQITGQFKTAFAEARGAGTAGAILNRLCEKSLSVAKRVRAETPLSEASLSIPALSVKLAKRIFPDIAETKILFVGIGEMIEIGMARFSAAPARSLSIANRTTGKAKPLAERYKAKRIPFEQVLDALPEFDIVYSCTSSAIPIIGKGALERALRKRKHRPMLLIDLAVPRDIEPEAGQLDDAFLYTVDDLGAMAAKAGKIRASSLSEANAIIEFYSKRFQEWMCARPQASLMSELRNSAEAIREAELEGALKQIRKGEPAEEVVRSMSRRITRKLLHPPTRLLGSASVGDEEKQMLARLYERMAADPKDHA